MFCSNCGNQMSKDSKYCTNCGAGTEADNHTVASNADNTNIFAIIGFIFSFMFFPAGIVLSIIALIQISKTQQGGKGLAIAGLIVSCLPVLLLIVIVLGLRGVYESVKTSTYSTESTPKFGTTYQCSEAKNCKRSYMNDYYECDFENKKIFCKIDYEEF